MHIEISIDKDGDRIGLPPSGVDYAMHVRMIDIIGEPLDQIANVDDEGAVDSCALYPVAVAIHDLQTTDVVLCQDGQIAIVRVRTDTDDVSPT
ncbi:hypothetical protein [Mesorhizobium sp. M7A.F.Ca.CA.001.11.2.1]|uniref:hypothetical protein n=1 Tax=Mesorhizobium sp. M7A.F.Ca.CA.001.11.2.1 TaxID=2496693 RepID=UPI001FE0E2C6|nr:hypothetical protein [Mesorhizobium sp. M7A.F.Ca.CA.001.11.2.1]